MSDQDLNTPNDKWISWWQGWTCPFHVVMTLHLDSGGNIQNNLIFSVSPRKSVESPWIFELAICPVCTEEKFAFNCWKCYPNDCNYQEIGLENKSHFITPTQSLVLPCRSVWVVSVRMGRPCQRWRQGVTDWRPGDGSRSGGPLTVNRAVALSFLILGTTGIVSNLP